MAVMIPDPPPARLSEPVAKLWRQLKRIQGDDVVCRVAFPIDDRPRPEFLILYKQRHAFLIAVSSLSSSELEEALHGDLFRHRSPASRLDLRARHTLEGFLSVLLDEIGLPDLPPSAVHRIIAFPNASALQVGRLAEIEPSDGTILLGHEDCRANALEGHFRAVAAAPLEDLVLDSLKGIFAAEARIPRNWMSREDRGSRSHTADQTDYFLDLDQEAAVRRDLELSNEGQMAASSQSLRLLTGVAGCGKTLVLMLRARAAAKVNPGARMLVLTHNKPLRSDLEGRAQELDPSVSIQWSTFLQWVRSLMHFSIIKPWEQETLLRELLESAALQATFSIAFLRDEFEWICDNAVQRPTLRWYLEVERSGRQRALQRAQREALFGLFQNYRHALFERGENDWPGVPQAFLRRIEEGQIRLPIFDSIYIDEAQFFTPVWFACLRHALAPERGNLFLVADPTQGFLRNGQSWLGVIGREVRGRSQRLQKPYRNTREIMEFAKTFYLSRVPQEDGEVNLPTEEYLVEMRTDEPPRFIHCATAQDEIARIVEEVTAAVAAGTHPGSLLILHPEQRELDRILAALSTRLPGEVVDAKTSRARDKVRLCTLNACTGIEAPIVLIAGLEGLFEAEAALGIDDTERNERIRGNTKKIFVALTRATERVLIFHTRAKLRSPFASSTPTQADDRLFPGKRPDAEVG